MKCPCHKSETKYKEKQKGNILCCIMKAEELKLFLELAEKAGSDTSEACEYMSKLKKSVKEAILAAHLEKYNIYFCESDGRYHS